jgi:hypothetical protein
VALLAQELAVRQLVTAAVAEPFLVVILGATGLARTDVRARLSNALTDASRTQAGLLFDGLGERHRFNPFRATG